VIVNLSATDPFTVVARAIVAALRARPAFMALVQTGNIVDMTDPAFQQFKENLSAADLPEVIVRQGAFAMKPLGRNSMAGWLGQTYELICVTDFVNSVGLNQINWQAFLALFQSGVDLGATGLVSFWQVLGGADSLVGPSGQDAQGSKRLVSALKIEVEMQVAKTTLQTL